MAVKFNLVKKLVREDSVNINQLIISTLFGSLLPEIYDEDKVYNKGDSVIIIDENGKYKLVTITKDNVSGPYDPDIWHDVSFTDIFKDSSIITQNNTIIKNSQEGMADDLATLVFNLAGLLDNDMEFNQIFRENFKNNDNLNIINGQYNMGSIESKNNILEFQLNEAKAMDIIPSKFKLKHYIEMIGVAGIECKLTFNGLDNEPFWFNANDAILDGSFFEIPEFEKEENIPYALNINIKCNCEINSSVKISDIMVVFI